MIRSTTILAVKQGKHVTMIGDGQVTLDKMVIKGSAKKVRRMYEDKVLAGFAGSTADAFTLFEKFEGKLNQYNGNLTRAAVELAKEWRGDKYLRQLDALLLVADEQNMFTISGRGDVIEPDDGIAAIGSGGFYALAAARALVRKTELSPSEVAHEAMKIASEICVFTNDQFVVEELK